MPISSARKIAGNMESQIFIKGDSSPEINLHLLPVNIQHNGKARVSQFFKIEENSEKLLNGIVI